MPRKREPMGKVKDILRLKVEAGLSHERIAAAVGLSKGAVTHYLQRALGLGTRSLYTRPTTAGLLVLIRSVWSSYFRYPTLMSAQAAGPGMPSDDYPGNTYAYAAVSVSDGQKPDFHRAFASCLPRLQIKPRQTRQWLLLRDIHPIQTYPTRGRCQIVCSHRRARCAHSKRRLD